MNWKNATASICVAVYTLLTMLSSNTICNGQTPEWKFTEGDQFDVTMTQASEITSYLTLANVDDQDKTGRTATSELTLQMQWQVKSVDEGVAVVEQKITRIRVAADTGADADSEIVIDTESDEELRGVADSLTTQMKSLIGLAFDVSMSPRGEVLEVSIPEATQEALRAIPGSMQIRQMMNEEGLADLYGQSVAVLPEDDLSDGESWETESDVQTALGPLLRTNRFTFEGVNDVDDRSLATFSIATELEQAGDNTESESRLVSFSGGGTMVMDVGAGHFVSSATSNVMNTEREYFDKTIVTTVQSDVEMQIEKK